jgi:carboxyl-terminal processing protease
MGLGMALWITAETAQAQSPKQNLRSRDEVRTTDNTGRQQFDAKQYMDLLGAALKELQIYYVDSIDYTKALRAGIDALLSELDPYTEFYDESDQDNFKTMTTGEYGGIGSLIMQRGDTVYISGPYEGNPAVEAGLRAGDAIISIDGERMVGRNSSDVSEKLRGQAGTQFRLEVLRPMESETRFFDIQRRKVVLPSVPYYGWMNDSIAYLHLDSFTDKAAADVQSALMQLRSERKLCGLVLDLRDNGGGLLDEAVKILGYFLPKGTTVVQTKARRPQWNSTYKTQSEPIDTTLRIAVLVDRGTASASEIVSGSLQDMDRAVILGERTFGKGLVQSTHSLPYNTLMKFTSAKYYIPSGRCIQAIDYRHGEEGGDVRIPDSLTQVFHTAGGREVRDGGGIKPDVERKPQQISTLAYYLRAGNHIFDYATRYRATHDSIAPALDFSITDEDYADFCRSMVEQKFSYARYSRKKLTELREAATLEGYGDAVRAELDTLDARLGNNLEAELQTFKPEIVSLINQEVATRYYYVRGGDAQQLKSDSLALQAVELLGDVRQYNDLLSPPKQEAVTSGSKPAKGKAKKNKK